MEINPDDKGWFYGGSVAVGIYLLKCIGDLFVRFQVWLSSFVGNDVKDIPMIRQDVAVIKVGMANMEKKTDKIDQIAHDVSTIKGQKEGVSNAVLIKLDQIEKCMNNKFAEYDRKFLVITNRGKRRK